MDHGNERHPSFLDSFCRGFHVFEESRRLIHQRPFEQGIRLGKRVFGMILDESLEVVRGHGKVS